MSAVCAQVLAGRSGEQVVDTLTNISLDDTLAAGKLHATLGAHAHARARAHARAAASMRTCARALARAQTAGRVCGSQRVPLSQPRSA